VNVKRGREKEKESGMSDYWDKRERESEEKKGIFSAQQKPLLASLKRKRPFLLSIEAFA